MSLLDCATCAPTNAKKITGTGGKDKTTVMGILERCGKGNSRVLLTVVDNTRKKTLQNEIRDHVLAGSAIFTDALRSYDGLDEFQHEVVDHAVEYVRGEVHTNGLEGIGHFHTVGHESIVRGIAR